MAQHPSNSQDLPADFDEHLIAFSTRPVVCVPAERPAPSAVRPPAGRSGAFEVLPAADGGEVCSRRLSPPDCRDRPRDVARAPQERAQIPSESVAHRRRHPGTPNQDVTAPRRATSVLVVDDHRTFSDLLAMALDHEPDLTCVGTAANVAEALAMVEELRPDLVLMDVHLGVGDGIAATAQLTQIYPELRVVVLTAHSDTALMHRAAEAGACGLVPKDGSLPDLLAALRSSSRGGLVVDPVLLKALVTSNAPRSHYLPPLTRREREVLTMLADGSDARTIAGSLGISVSTCRGYLKNLMLKLDAHSQLEAVVIATHHGLVRVGSHR
jgi:DNA-binding NarL/FixJ family response regulator